MSRYDYLMSQQIASMDVPFDALIMAAMRQADTDNQLRLQRMWPDTWDELHDRYNAPGGLLSHEGQA